MECTVQEKGVKEVEEEDVLTEEEGNEGMGWPTLKTKGQGKEKLTQHTHRNEPILVLERCVDIATWFHIVATVIREPALKSWRPYFPIDVPLVEVLPKQPHLWSTWMV